MYIESLKVEGFGQFANYPLAGLGPGIQVIHGPNEAGKSTLRSFVRWMLFGRQHGDKKLWTNRYGHFAGTIDLVTGPETVTVVRRDTTTEVRYGDRNLTGEVAVAGLLGGMDLALYNAIFTFDLFDLQQIDALKSDRVQNLLAVGATLGGGVHPADILASLEREADRYWRPRAKGVLVREAKRSLRERETALGTAKANAEQYQLIQEQLVDAAANIKVHRRRLAAARAEHGMLNTLREMWPVWAARRVLVDDLARLGDEGELESSDRDRVDRSRAAWKEAVRRAEEADEQLAEATAEVDAVEVDERLLSAAAAVEALADRMATAEADVEQLESFTSSVDELEEAARRALEQLGPEWNASRVGAIRLDASVIADAQRHSRRTASAIERVPAQLSAASEAVQAVEREAAELEEKLRSVETSPVEVEEQAVRSLTGQASSVLPLAAELRDSEAQLGELGRGVGLEEGWPELEESQLDEMRTWRERWREALAAREERLAAARARVEEGAAKRASAASELAKAERLPGADEPEARQVALVETKWPATRDAIEREDQLRAELESLDARVAAQPKRLGQRVEIAALRAVATGAATRSGLVLAFDDCAALAKRRDELQVLLDGTSVGEITSVEEAEQKARVARERRRCLIEAQAALSAFRQARDQQGTATEPKSGAERWLGPLLLTGLAVALGIAAQWLFAAMAVVAGLVAAAVAWRMASGRGPQEIPELGAAKNALAKALRAAGLDARAGEAEIQVALAEVREEIERQERRRTVIVEHQAAAERRNALMEERGTVEESLKAERGRLSELLERAGVPRMADRSLAVAWLDVATELGSIDQRRAELERSRTAAADRVSRFLRVLEPLVGAAPQGRDEIEEAISQLARRQLEATARTQAIARAQVRLDEASQALELAESALLRLGDEPPVPQELSIGWSAWAQTHGVPPSPPDAELVAGALRAVKATLRLRERSELMAKLEEVRPTVDQFEAEARRLAAVVGLPEGASVPQIIEALREALSDAVGRRATRRELEAQRARVDGERLDVQADLERAREAERELTADQEAFDQWARVVQAPEHLEPNLAEEWVARLTAAREATRDLDTAHARRGRCKARVDVFAAEVEELARRLGEDPPGDFEAGGRAVRDWRMRLKSARENSAKKGERKERVSVLDAASERRAAEREVAVASWEAALATVNCADEGEWDERVRRAEQRREHRSERDKHTARLAGALGAGWETDPRLEKLASGDLAGWDTEAALVKQEVDQLDEQLEQLEAERGELLARSRDLETSASVPELALQAEGARTALRKAEREWWRLQIARHLLAETFERFRRERQPAVLLRASKWFQVATDGAYEGLEVDDGSTLSFYAKGADRSLHPASQLSTGTTGILYLCLRMALALDQAAQVRPVPLLLDDVLAHFDPARARAAARLLAEVSRDEDAPQLLLFTCRPESIDVLREADPDVSLLEIPRWAGAGGPVPRDGVTVEGVAGQAGRRGVARAGSTEGQGPNLNAAIGVLASAGQPLARSDFLDAMGLTGNDWTNLRLALEADPRVRVTGERRGRRYELR